MTEEDMVSMEYSNYNYMLKDSFKKASIALEECVSSSYLFSTLCFKRVRRGADMSLMTLILKAFFKQLQFVFKLLVTDL